MTFHRTRRILPLVALALVLAAVPATAQQQGPVVTVQENFCPDPADRFCFAPASLDLPGNSATRLTLNNTGERGHSLCIEGAGRDPACTPEPDQGIAPDTSATVEFQTPATGQLRYYCAVDDHRARGMEGVITLVGGPRAGTNSSDGETNATNAPGNDGNAGNRGVPALPAPLLLAAAAALALALRRRGKL